MIFRSVATFLAIALLSACEQSDGAGIDCFSIDDCKNEQTCFFGRCVDVGYALTSVYGELTPPNDSPWLEQQAGPINLEDGRQDIVLEDSVRFSGEFGPDAGAVQSYSGELLIHSTYGKIPGRDLVRHVNVSEQGFEMNVLRGIYTMTFQPSETRRPPKSFAKEIIKSAPPQNFSYPADNELQWVSGRLLAKPLSEWKMPDATIYGTAANPNPDLGPLRSTLTQTNADGIFEIAFLPEATNFFTIHVGLSTSDFFVPETEFPDRTIVEEPNSVGDLVLGIDGLTQVTAVVEDQSGASIVGANIRFDGYSVGDAGGQFVTNAASDGDGRVSTEVLPGDYLITVAPQKAQRYGLISKVARFDGVQTVRITVPDKVWVGGCVTSRAGARVTKAEVVFTRRNSPVPRRFETTTNSDGCYSVAVDPGYVDEDELEPAEYELVIKPDVESGLPFFRKLMLVRDTTMSREDVELYEPAIVYGMVRDPMGMPLGNVIIAFYSLELDPNEPLLVGVSQTLDGTRAGEFVLPVPLLK